MISHSDLIFFFLVFQWRNLPARDNRGEHVDSSPSVAEKGGLNKGLLDPEGISSPSTDGNTALLAVLHPQLKETCSPLITL